MSGGIYWDVIAMAGRVFRVEPPPVVTVPNPTATRGGEGGLNFDPFAHGHESAIETRRSYRWDALLGNVDVHDPLPGEPERPFIVNPAAFLGLATQHSPRRPEATVSAFSSWVYSLYTAEPDASVLEAGRRAEAEIFDLRARDTVWFDTYFADPPRGDWQLAYNGMDLSSVESRQATWMEIPSLCIHGEPLRGSPDLVYQHAKTGEIVIVEIKFTRKPIPSNLWPNVWAQLWAYSNIWRPSDSPNMRVVGEVWGEMPGRRFQKNPLLCLRKVVRHDPRRRAFDRFFGDLFAIYSGASSGEIAT